MTYQQTATRIIKESIKSAVFIDEDAQPFFEPASEPEVLEERLSRELYSNFKNDGITLDIHKFAKGDETNAETVQYLFDRRDLVLLDWKLDKNDGELLSLKLLSEIVGKEHIHFCAIYTKETDARLDEIFWNILSYFSGETREYYKELGLELADVEEKVTPLISEIKYHSQNRFNLEFRKERGLFLSKHRDLISRVVEASEESNRLCALIKAGIAFSNEHTSEVALSCPTMISSDSRTITINNTIVTILNKHENEPSVLVDNFSKQISENSHSFLQLLGLESHQIFTQKAAFIDSNMLPISKEAFLYHRQQKNEENFSDFIKEVLIEKARLIFRDEEISLLNDTLLDEMSKDGLPSISDNEIQAMNIFYNSVQMNGSRKLNFGDVFKFEARYFICITALCDCQTPKKNMFYFAEGKVITAKKALDLGDSAFISYLYSGEIVRWTEDKSDVSVFTPVYIKPVQFIIPNNEINDNKLTLTFLNEDADVETLVVEYVTTIKQNYTQRIANHAFTHPVRVGIDFVKKAN